MVKFKSIVIVIVFALISVVGCEETCKTDGTGDVKIKNTRSSTIVVELDGVSKTISSGSTVTFYDVPEYTCYCNVTYNGTKWIDVSMANCSEACETVSLEY